MSDQEEISQNSDCGFTIGPNEVDKLPRPHLTVWFAITVSISSVMSAPTVLSVPYGGTINSEPEGDFNTPITEFYRLPLKQKNEITICVKAASDARILLFDTGADGSPSKVEVVIGGNGNKYISVGMATEDATFPKEQVAKSQLLSATHWKAFTIRWYKGRVMVYNHGYLKPLITWDGPKEAGFSHVGVKTVGCAGEWRVQAMPKITTAADAPYNDIEINSGRLDFEVSAFRDAYVMFTAQPTAARTPPPIHCILGYSNSIRRSAVFYNWIERNPAEETENTLSTNEFRRFWCQWDANNVMIGRGGSDAPFTQWLKCGTPVTPIRYFGLQAYGIGNDYCYWHILDRIRDEDKAPRERGEQEYTGAELGYTNYQYISYT